MPFLWTAPDDRPRSASADADERLYRRLDAIAQKVAELERPQLPVEDAELVSFLRMLRLLNR